MLMATTSQILPDTISSRLKEGTSSPSNGTADKVNKHFFTLLSHGLTLFSILAGASIALLWNVSLGLLCGGIGLLAITLALVVRFKTIPENPASSDQNPANNEPAIVTAKSLTADENIRIFQETLAIFSGTADSLKLAANSVVKVTLPRARPAPERQETRIYVSNTSTFRTTQDLCKRGLNPLVMDMANATHVAGGLLRGANAQEELVGRQSDLWAGLKALWDRGCYPIPELGGLLLPGVTFFREDPNEGYKMLERGQEFKADVFAVAAYVCIPGHETSRGFRPESDEVYLANTTEKIKNYFRAAIENGNDSIVASALGCGAFKNKPHFIANLFRRTLKDPEFQGQFKEVVFGIIEDLHSESSNYQIFKDVLERR